MVDARRRHLDAVVVWRLDRFGRNLRHLITALDELRALDVGVVSIGEGIDTTTPVGRMNAGILSAKNLARVAKLTVREAADVLKVPATRVHRARTRLFQKPTSDGNKKTERSVSARGRK